MKALRLLLLLVVSITALQTTGGPVLTEPRPLISDEMIPFILQKNSVTCQDAVPNHGFGRFPGYLDIDETNIFEPTLRLQGVNFRFTLPEDVNCASITGLNDIPSQLLANRKIYRTVQVGTIDENRLFAELVTDITLEIPTKIDGNNIFFTGTQAWSEQTVSKQDAARLDLPLPQTISYLVRTHPQSGAHGVGLFCEKTHGTIQDQLTIGGISRQEFGGLYSNTNLVARPFNNATECEEKRAQLLRLFEAQDPRNDGTIFRVNRTIASKFRFMSDIDGKAMCQKIEQDNVSIIVDSDQRFTGTTTFPISTVDISYCK